MKVEELFRRLSYGELSNLAVGTEGSGAIEEAKYPQIILYANEGLKRLFTRFMLREKDVMIEMVSHITNYHLRKKFAETTGSDTPWPYIKDLPDEPFEEDVVKILGVYDSMGRKLPLNDMEDKTSLFTPQPDILQVPDPKAGQALGIAYQAYHRPLFHGAEGGTVDQETVLEQEIEIPQFLEGALQSYVAYKVYSHINGQENQMKSQEFLGTFTEICIEIEDRDLVNSTYHTSHSKLEQRGFV